MKPTNSIRFIRTLILCALAALAACQKPVPPTVQDSYSSMGDCVADWASSSLCRMEGTTAQDSHAWGPRYFEAERPQLVRQDESASRKLGSRPGAPKSPAAGTAAGAQVAKTK
jgi:uncharacterized protein YgiB involved in biofilm formation